MSVIGVALRSNSRKPSSIVCLEGGEKLRLVLVDTFDRDEELLKIVKICRPEVVAIGSPLSLPRGLDCLETTCPCRPLPSYEKGREAERQLAQVGICIFPTMKDSVVKPLIYRGVSLRRTFQDRGMRVIEVYPYATAVLSSGGRVPKRGSQEKIEFLKDALGQKIEGLTSYAGRLNEQAYNALLSAFTAWLYIHGDTQELGDEEEGLIIIPRGLVQILQSEQAPKRTKEVEL